MAMNLPARLCARSASGPICGDDLAMIASRWPSVPRGTGFVNLQYNMTIYSLVVQSFARAGQIVSQGWHHYTDTLQSESQGYRRPVAGRMAPRSGDVGAGRRHDISFPESEEV